MAANAGPAGDAPTSSVIVDGTTDIAYRINKERMMTQATGRRTFQHVFLSTPPSGKASTQSYNPAKDAPNQGEFYPKLPQPEELNSSIDTREYLEVGLMFGREPSKYMAEAGKKDDHRNALKERGVLPRAEDAMRVFISVTEYLQNQAKLYVGCHPVQGLLQTRTISAACVFFYAEFWEGITDPTLKKRENEVLRKLKLCAARKKEAQPGRNTATITCDEASLNKFLRANAISVSKSENVLAKVVLLWGLFKTTNNPEYITDMKTTLEDAGPDYKYGPQTSTQGACAFMDFNESFTDEDASMLADELKTQFPQMVQPNPAIIKKIRGSLCTDVNVGEDVEKLGEQLPYLGLGFFLAECHNNVGIDFAPEVTLEVVKQAISATDNHLIFLPLPTIRNRFNEPDKNGDGEVSRDNFRRTLSCVQATTTTLRDNQKAMQKVIENNHGGLLPNRTYKALMEEIGTVVDRDTLQHKMEQVGGLHAITRTAFNNKTVMGLENLTELVNKVLIIDEEKHDDQQVDDK